MHKRRHFFLNILTAVAVLISFFPASVSADHSFSHSLQQLQEEISILQTRVSALAAILLAAKPEGTGKPEDTGQPADTGKPAETPATPAPATPAKTPSTPATPPETPSQSQSRGGGGGGGASGGGGPTEPVQSSPDSGTPAKPSQPQDRGGGQSIISPPPTPAREGRAGEPVRVEPPPAPKAPDVLNLNRSLEQGRTGDDVKGVQELLAKFPDIYPRGLVTGFFGPLSEQAVKKLQEKFGLEQVGIVGPKTRGVVEELATAVGRKGRPHITDISPSSISIGSEVNLSGTGFTFEDNAIFLKGRIVIKELSSPDGSSLKFIVPPDIPCALHGPACPVKVVNKNGISNAKPFKLVKVEFPPEPIEPPVITPPPPPPEPVLTSISPSYGRSGTAVTLYGSGFTPSSNSINLAGVSSVISGLSSPDGKTLAFTMPSSPCKVLEPCGVTVTNANGTSNSVSFTLTQPVTPITVTRPNGGEQFVQGTLSTISWTGGTDAVHVALVEESAVPGIDPMSLLVGWISTTTLPSASLLWNSQTACAASGGSCYPVSPGNYKMLVISENELGKVAIELDGSGNWDLSDQAFTILAPPSITVLTPNGGERVVYGSTVTISWDATSIVSRAVNIKLLKGGVVYQTIAANVSQGAANGSFLYNWVVPSTLPASKDYAIEISDSTNPPVKDVSDSVFGIGPQASIVVVRPNGGETWFKGFQTTIRWNSGNIVSQAVNVDLYQGGVLVRRLGSNVPQRLYAWSTQTYSSGTDFNYTFTVPIDLADGSGYIVQISDSADDLVKDVSDAGFTVQAVPNPVTVNGRLVHQFLTTPLANTRLYLDGGYRYANTGSDGEFTVSTSTASLLDSRIFRGIRIAMPVGSWPNCFMNWRYDIFAANEYPYWRDHVFDLQTDKTGIFNQGTLNLGNVPMWPGTGLYFYTNVGIFSPGVSTAASPGVMYPDSGYWGWQILALEVDLQVKVYDPVTNTYHLSPSLRIPLASGCTPKTLTYLDGAFKWEPYNVRSQYSLPYTLTVGATLNTTFTAVGGIAPYTWGLYYGSLPPGLSLDPTTGQVTGVVTTPGTYKFQVRITDAAGVKGGTWPITTIVK